MATATLETDLFHAICEIPLIDPHSHINPHRPTAKTLDDLLGYHYYTELAHSAGMSKECLAADFDPNERVRTILQYMGRFDNTVQYSWFLEIARTFLGFEGDRVTAADTDYLWDTALKEMARPDWEEHVLKTSNVEKVFLTNDFDDPLEGFDTERYVPCLRVDDLVFKINHSQVRQRLAKVTGIEVSDGPSLRMAIRRLFQHFASRGAKACAISLPPHFSPLSWVATKTPDDYLSLDVLDEVDDGLQDEREDAIFWMLTEECRHVRLPFDLMIGVIRGAYENGVYQGQDLLRHDCSLSQFNEYLNRFADVTFCISVLSSPQNQELASYSWIFPNVVTSGHWWYSNIPAYIKQDCRARLQAVPRTKQIGYYSDAYKLEFILPKYNMYRRILARVLARDYMRDRGWSQAQAVALARDLLRDNIQRIFRV